MGGLAEAFRRDRAEAQRDPQTRPLTDIPVSDGVDALLTAAAESLTPAEALEQLAALKGADPERAHGAAEVILLQLIQNPAITAAFHAVPKWYA